MSVKIAGVRQTVTLTLFMKNCFTIPVIFIIAFISTSIILTSCKKDNGDETTVFAVTSKSATNVGQGWATLNGSVNPENRVCTLSFEYDTTTAYNYFISATPETVSGDTTKNVYANLSGLSPDTKYYFRLKAEYPGGTTYGSDLAFTTTSLSQMDISFNPDLDYGSVTDIDGNIYKTIVIGTQTWMAENLKTARYNDGTVIPFVPVASTWAALSTPGYCWYHNDSVSYGVLFNWYAVSSDNVCPQGWHVPDDEDWTILINYLGGENNAGAKLKETGTVHWTVPNYGATNESGFTALGAGYRNLNGVFSSIKQKGYWWSTTEYSSTQAHYNAMGYNYSNTDNSSTFKESGFSVRCVKDN
jgi:uncharacterized protein (TIGR02145 family)